MRVLWTHNFDPSVATSGVFMHTAARGLRAQGVDLHLEYLGNLRSPAQILRARKRIRDMAKAFDLVHAQYGSACALATSAAQGIPRVLTIRGSDWQVLRSSVGFHYLHTRLAAWFTRRALPRFDCVVAVSQRMSSELARAAPNVRHEVMPSPIDLTRFVALDRQQAKARLGFPDSTEKWVLFNSRNLANPVKRYALAQQAFDIAQARRGDLRLRLATDLAHAEVPLFVAACDVILCTSENEGWPNSLKEALACNVPFVSTDVGDMAKIAQMHPLCRVVAADAQAIADQLDDVLSQPPSSDLRAQVADMSLEGSSDRLLSLYSSLLG